MNETRTKRSREGGEFAKSVPEHLEAGKCLDFLEKVSKEAITFPDFLEKVFEQPTYVS
jgi:hypothetical protein